MFALFEDHFDSAPVMELTEDTFTGIREARLALNELNEFEERFWVVCELFRELQESALAIANSESTYFTFDDIDFMRVRSVLSVKLMAFLAAARLYLDQCIGSVRKISSGGIADILARSNCSDAYDNSFEYRLLYGLRNFALHKSFPVHSMSINRSKNDDRTILGTSIEFSIPVQTLLEWAKLKAALRVEIEKLSEKQINLKSAARKYFALICRLHINFRGQLDPFTAEASEKLSKASEIWHSHSGKPIAVGLSIAILCDEGLKIKGEPITCLKPPDDKFRKMIREKTKTMGNLEKHRVVDS